MRNTGDHHRGKDIPVGEQQQQQRPSLQIEHKEKLSHRPGEGPAWPVPERHCGPNGANSMTTSASAINLSPPLWSLISCLVATNTNQSVFVRVRSGSTQQAYASLTSPSR